MPLSPIKNAAAALRYWGLRHQTTVNNLANANTPGFKAERVFGELLADRSIAGRSETDMRAGSVQETRAPLDVAVGDGEFLVVRTEAGERLVRGGTLRLDDGGRLVDQRGDAVMGEGGELILPPGTIEIARNGEISVAGVGVGRLRVVTVADLQGLQHEDGGRFRSEPGTMETVIPEHRGIRQGFLEDSNVQSLEGLVELITIQRNYGSVERMVEALDGILGRAVNDLGRAG